MVEQSVSANPLVSVIIPAYERGYILSRSIDSVLQQTLIDFEIIVVNDGSTDNTEAIVAEYDDPRIKYWEHESNKGVSAARNTGIEQASGKYIAFLDSDDEWVPEKLEYQIQELERTKAGIIYSDHFVLRNGSLYRVKSPEIENADEHYIDVFNSHIPPLTSTLVVRKECLGSDRFDESLQGPEDIHFMVRLFKKCRPAKVQKPLVYYRYLPTSLSHDDAARFQRNHTRSVDDLVDRFPELKQYYDEKRATDLWKFAFKFAREGQLVDARQLARQSITTSPSQLLVIPAYGLLFVSYLPLGPFRLPLLRLSEIIYQRLAWSGMV